MFSPTNIAVLIGLFALSGFFSGAETAITALWPWKVRELAAKEDGDGPFTLLQGDVTRFLTTILVGNNLVNVAIAALITDAATRTFGSAGVGYATGIVTLGLLFFGEITPKSIAVHNADQLARFVVYPIYLLSILLYPVGRVFTWASARVLRLLRLEPSANPLVTENELRLILHGAEKSGAIEGIAQEMISGVLQMNQTPAEAVMVPRVDIIGIEQSSSIDSFLELARTHGFSRLPVYNERIDNVVGVAYTKELVRRIAAPGWRDDLRLSELSQPAYFVPESMPASALMLQMRRRKTHMAIVLDEFGGVAGLVTLEDLVEEILGEIYDEHDLSVEPDIERLPEGEFSIRGPADLDAVARYLGVELPEGDYNTLSGLLLDMLGSIPAEGEEVEVAGYRFEVVEADRRRILRVRARPVDEVTEGAPPE